MDVFEAIQKRRSVRTWERKPVEEEKLDQVLEAARLAPSARNMQEWRLVVVRDAELRRRLIEAANGQDFVGQAPVVIAACAIKTDHVMSCGHPSHLLDLAIAVDHMTLAARELELGTCWIGAFKQEEVREVLDIPESVEVVALLPMGYPLKWPDARPRKPKSDLVRYDGWSV